MWAAARPCAGKGGGPRRPRSLCHRGRPRPARRPPHPAWLPPRALAQRRALPPRVGRGQLGLAACDWLGRPPVTPRGSLPLTDGERPPPPPGCVRAVRGGAPPLAGAAVSQRDAPPLPAGAGPLPARPCGEHLRPLAGRAVRQQRLRLGSAAPCGPALCPGDNGTGFRRATGPAWPDSRHAPGVLGSPRSDRAVPHGLTGPGPSRQCARRSRSQRGLRQPWSDSRVWWCRWPSPLTVCCLSRGQACRVEVDESGCMEWS